MLFDQIEDLALDRSDMLGEIYRQAEQLETGLAEWGGLRWQKRADEYWHVLICGMGGGAGVAGHFVRDYLWDRCSVPIDVVAQPVAPAYIGPNTLAFFISTSGNTPEVVAAFDAIRRAGGQCVILAGGGKLMQGAREAGFPAIELKSKMPPRTQIATYILKILEGIEYAGLCGVERGEIEEAIAVLKELREEFRPERNADQNPLKLFARELTQYPAVIYGERPVAYLPALRLKWQLNENAKLPAHANSIPAYHHDELLGWDAPPSVRRNFALILMRDNREDAESRGRLETTKKLLKSHPRYLRELCACGQSRFARTWSLILQADYLSAYCALARGLDPTPLQLIKDYYETRKTVK